MMSESALKNRWVQLAVLMLIVAAVFGNSLANGFVWDDLTYLLGNSALTKFNLKRILFSSAIGIEYFPVREITLAWDYVLWRESAFGFHLTNLILYGLNVATVYLLTREILLHIKEVGAKPVNCDDSPAPFLTALLFALHPIHCEVVNWISARGSLLTGLFFFPACIFYLRSIREGNERQLLHYVAAGICFVLALLSKTYGIILPLALLLFSCLGRGGRPINHYLKLIPFFVIAGAAYIYQKQIAATAKIVTESRLLFSQEHIDQVIGRALQIPFFYLKKLLIPYGYAAEYNAELLKPLTDPVVIVAALTLLLISGAAFTYRKRFQGFFLSWFWFIATLIPFLNFFSTTPVVADRYAYLPSYAICFLAAVTISSAGSDKMRQWILTAAIALAILPAVVSFKQNRVWKSDSSLWAHAVEVAPTAYAYKNLGIDAFGKKRYDEAFKYFAMARELSPGEQSYNYYQGVLALEKGAFDQAVSMFAAVVAKTPDFVRARGHLALALDQLGRYPEALEQYLILSSLPVQKWQYAYNTANIYKKMGNFPEAVRFYEKSLVLNPDNPDACNNLGLIYRNMKNYKEAVTWFERAAAIDSRYPFAPYNLAETYYLMGENEKAVRLFNSTAEKFPELRGRIAIFMSRLNAKK